MLGRWAGLSRRRSARFEVGLERGAVILFEGAAASIAGARRLNAQAEWTAGLNFIQNALISSSADAGAAGNLARFVHQDFPEISIMVLTPGSALALGPAQRIETWGKGDVTIRLPDPAGAERNRII